MTDNLDPPPAELEAILQASGAMRQALLDAVFEHALPLPLDHARIAIATTIASVDAVLDADVPNTRRALQVALAQVEELESGRGSERRH